VNNLKQFRIVNDLSDEFSTESLEILSNARNPTQNLKSISDEFFSENDDNLPNIRNIVVFPPTFPPSSSTENFRSSSNGRNLPINRRTQQQGLSRSPRIETSSDGGSPTVNNLKQFRIIDDLSDEFSTENFVRFSNGDKPSVNSVPQSQGTSRPPRIDVSSRRGPSTTSPTVNNLKQFRIVNDLSDEFSTESLEILSNARNPTQNLKSISDEFFSENDDNLPNIRNIVVFPPTFPPSSGRQVLKSIQRQRRNSFSDEFSDELESNSLEFGTNIRKPLRNFATNSVVSTNVPLRSSRKFHINDSNSRFSDELSDELSRELSININNPAINQNVRSQVATGFVLSKSAFSLTKPSRTSAIFSPSSFETISDSNSIEFPLDSISIEKFSFSI